MKRILYLLILIQLFVTNVDTALAQQRFPKPEFENGHLQPKPTAAMPRALLWEYADVLVLVVCLSLASYFAIYRRSRRGMFWLSLFSLFYFGFVRLGCVCSVGAVQNVALALANSAYVVPLTVIAFFVIPLIFSLFAGRVFCAGVCPLGAIQDIVALRPIELPRWLQSVLGLIPYIYLGFSVLFAATGSDFIICRYDPFVAIFRFDGMFNIFVLAALFLGTGIFIARPYCRFFCPYSVLLNWTSRFAKKHLTITPSVCVQCKLCETSCPFGAIEKPITGKISEPKSKGVRRLVLMVAIVPLLMLGTGWMVSSLNVPLSRVHAEVRLAEKIAAESKGESFEGDLAVTTFKSMGKPMTVLMAEVQEIRRQFRVGGWFLGTFLGLAFGLTLVNLSVNKQRTDYEPNRGTCLSCARCIDYCPVDKSDTDI